MSFDPRGAAMCAFVVRANLAPSSPVQAILALKDLLVEVGWDVLAETSSDLSDPRGWFVLRHPENRWQLCFQRTELTTDWRIKKAPAFALGSGTVSKAPGGGPFEVFLLGGGSDEHPTFAALFGDSENRLRFHAVALRTKPFGFWSAGLKSGSSELLHGLMVDPLRSEAIPSTDPDPFVYYVASAGAFSVDSLASAVQCSIREQRREVFGPAVPALYRLPSGVRVYPGGMSPNPFSGRDESLPVIFFRRGCYKGLSGFTQWLGTRRAVGTTLSRFAPRDHVVLGDVVLPWGGEVLVP
jgi:hypothetical protein